MIDKEKLKQARIQIAIGLASEDPSLINLVQARNPIWGNEARMRRGIVLRNLMKLEPCIGHMLRYYGRRMRA